MESFFFFMINVIERILLCQANPNFVLLLMSRLMFHPKVELEKFQNY